MPPARQSQAKANRRVTQACERCRVMKVKCSGSHPCARCSRKKKACHFAVLDKRVSVPESYLQELQQRSSRGSELQTLSDLGAELSNGPSPSRVNERQLDQEDGIGEAGDAPSYDTPQEFFGRQPERSEVAQPGVSSHESVSPQFRQNPLVDYDFTFAPAEGKYWYMGPSSSWSFCRRVLALLGKRLPDSNFAPDPWHLDGVAFKIQWKPLGYDEIPDVSNLPPLDYALFLFNSVKFYFGVMFYIIDEPSYLKHLKELYEDPIAKATESRLWFAQYLLILAFGKAISSSSAHRDAPPGYQYAVRAMALMPNLSGMNDALQSIEALALASLYFQSIDMRMAAFHHIGQALRTCILEGMHRCVPEEVVGAELAKRSNKLFWVVYMLERDFSAQVGGPSTIRDEDITAKLPSHNTEGLDAWVMSLYIRLSRLTARILTTVYGVGKDFNESLVKNTQSILRNLAQLSSNLTDLLNTHFQGCVSKASRIALRLVLAYHHCIVLTTRPLVMCALYAHFDESQSSGSGGTISLTPPVSSLIQSCVDSAQTILGTLRVLGDDDSLEAFLPFQLEDAFSSAFLLHLIRTISPSLIPDDSWRSNIDMVLDQMIAQGSLVAPLRKLELGQLESMMASMTPASNPVMTPPASTNAHAGPAIDDTTIHAEGLTSEHGWDIFEDDGGMGLSAQELLDLAEQLDVDYLINTNDI